MPIAFRCHHCGGQFAAPDQLAGKQARCQACGAVVNVPFSVAASTPVMATDVGGHPFSGVPPMGVPARRFPTGWIIGGVAAAVLVGVAIAAGWAVVSTVSRTIAAAKADLLDKNPPRKTNRSSPAADSNVSQSSAAISAPPPAPSSAGNDKSAAPIPLTKTDDHPGMGVGGGSVVVPGLPNLPAPAADRGRGKRGEDTALRDAEAKHLTPWEARPDPPPVPVEYKKGKIAISLPGSAQLRLPAGPSHFILAMASDFRRQVWQVFDLRTGKEIGKPLENRLEFNFRSEAFSPDGRYLAAVQQRGGDEIPIGVWSFVTGDMLRSLRIKAFRVTGPLRFAGPHELVTLHDSSWNQSVLTLWSLQTGEKLREISLPNRQGNDQLRPESLAISPGGKYAALIMGARLGVIDLQTGQPSGTAPLSAAPWSCEGVAFSPDGAELAVLVNEWRSHRLYCFDFATGRLLLDHDYNGTLAHFIYDGPLLDWLPDKSGLVYAGHVLLDRTTGEDVWIFPTTDASPRRVIREGEILVLLSGRGGKVLQNAELDEKAIAKAMQSVRAGGVAFDAILPPVTTPNLFSTAAVTLPSGSTPWTAVPDPVARAARSIDRDILLAKDGETIRRVTFATAAAGKVVVQKEITPKALAGRRAPRQVVLERYDLATGEKGQSLELAPAYQLGDVSPSGKLALVALTQEGNRYDRLDVLGLAPKKHIAGWRPYAGEKEEQAEDSIRQRSRHTIWSLPSDPHSVVWAALLDDEHVLTVNTTGKLVCWKLPECQARYYVDNFGEPLALSPGRKYLAGGHFGEFRIFDAQTGACLGDLQSPALGSTAIRGVFRPDGKELAAIIDAGLDKMLVRWDLTSGKLLHEVPVPPAIIHSYAPFYYSYHGERPGLEYRGDEFLLVDDQYLIDLGKRAVIWRYHLPVGLFAANSPDHQSWYCSFKNNTTDRTVFLTSLATPSASVLQKADSVSLERQLILYPGLSVRLLVDLSAVGLSGLAPSVEQTITQALELRGLKVDPSAPLAFSLVAAERSTGKQIEFYETSGSAYDLFQRRPPVETLDQQELVCRLAISEVNGHVLWFKDRSAAMPLGASVRPGKVAEDMREKMLANFKSLLQSSGAATDTLPRYIFRDLDAIMAGQSQLGFHNEQPPPQAKLRDAEKQPPGLSPGT